jgi:competence protein ComEA
MRFFPVLAALLCSMPLCGVAGPVDINTADAATLARELKGIGPVRAQAIVAYRTQHGPFKSADDLALVKSVPQRVVEDNRDNIRLEKTRLENARPAAAKPKAPAATVPQ